MSVDGFPLLTAAGHGADNQWCRAVAAEELYRAVNIVYVQFRQAVVLKADMIKASRVCRLVLVLQGQMNMVCLAFADISHIFIILAVRL